MSPEMKFDVAWLPPFQGAPEIGRTSASLEIHFGSENATRLEDAWSQSVQPGCRVALYPLAMWLAWSWWRIRWEPAPSRIHVGADRAEADSRWRMGHEVAAAGQGFLWPPLTFASDGESIQVTCRATPSASQEPVRYLSNFETSLPAGTFEREVDAFMDLVLRRLDALGNTDLHVVWSEVLRERSDERHSSVRRLEALLGFDPDEAPEQVLSDLFGLRDTAGTSAADEIAVVCGGAETATRLRQVTEFAAQSGTRGSIALRAPNGLTGDHPWQRGAALADAVREQLGLNGNPISDGELSEILRIGEATFATPDRNANGPLGLGIRTEGSNVRFLFRKRNRAARRFEGARFLADALCHPNDRWLPSTDAATARQKVQRAFAAEFLCPIETLKNYLGKDFAPEAFEDAAEHFGISELAIKSHLANHLLIPRQAVDLPLAT